MTHPRIQIKCTISSTTQQTRKHKWDIVSNQWKTFHEYRNYCFNESYVSNWVGPLHGLEHYIKLLTIVIWRFAIFWGCDILFWNCQLALWNLGLLALDSFFTFSSHTEYVKRELIVIPWLKKKNSLLSMNVYVFYVLEDNTSKKKFCLSVWMSVWLFDYTYIRGSWLWTQ